ncbi:hypothetical protein D3C78_1631580 [compost metagenome]
MEESSKLTSTLMLQFYKAALTGSVPIERMQKLCQEIEVIEKRIVDQLRNETAYLLVNDELH